MADWDDYDPPSDVLDDVIAERKRAAASRHWCTECHGHTGPGSPCHVPDDEDEPTEEDLS